MNVSKNSTRRLALTGIAAFSIATASMAQGGASFDLIPSEPLDVNTFAVRASEAADAPTLKSLAPPSDLATAPFAAAGLLTKEGDGAGCTIDPASPAIGTDVPLSYFGVPPSTTNPFLVGPVQLLASGPLNTRNRTITLPLYRGYMQGTGEVVWYIATDSTDEENAAALGLNFAAKLAFGATGRGVRNATLTGNGLMFERGRVDFSPERNVVAGPEPTPFPPVTAEPGSIGDQYYTPLTKIVNAGGHIYNLSVIAQGTPAIDLRFADGTPDYSKVHDSVADIRPFAGTVTLDLAPGFSFAKPVLYLSLETNLPLAAALEAATFAPGLEDIEVGADDSLFSAVERIFGFTNGQRGCENPHRQGFEAAVTDGAAPFNVLGGIPTVATDYSPLWDLNLGEWTQEAIDAGYRARLIDEFQILSFVENGFVTGPGGAEYGSTGIIINCPIVFRFL